jgi:hypothetical protein
MTDKPKNLNDDLHWSDFAVEDLRHGIQQGESIREIAELLCRSEDQVRAKAIELGLLEDARRAVAELRRP